MSRVLDEGDDDEEFEAMSEAWEYVHMVLNAFADTQVDPKVAKYVPILLSWRVAEVLAKGMDNRDRVRDLVDLMEGKTRHYLESVVEEWKGQEIKPG